MRFLAAFAVFACHASFFGYFTEGTAAHLPRFVLSAGWGGVEFFFLLSGFVLAWSVREREPKPLFWRRRLLRIYPNYLVVWLAAIGLALSAHAFLQSLDYPDLLPSLFMVHTWYPNLSVIESVNPVSWSLGCEMFFYLMFPFLYGLLKRIPDNRLWWSVGAVTATIAVLPVIVTLASSGPPNMFNIENITPIWFVQYFPPTRCLDFVLGILMARIVRANRWIGLGIVPELVILAVGVALQVLAYPTAYAAEAPVALPIALLMTAAAVADASGRRSPFRARWLVWLGGLTYAFYLSHFLILAYGHIPLGAARTWPLPAALGILAGVLAVTIAVAWLVTRLVEEPAMRRWARPRPRPSVPAETRFTALALLSTPEAGQDPGDEGDVGSKSAA
jgi:peptidoglycan/LPS O-acetylase OafA/YrhL